MAKVETVKIVSEKTKDGFIVINKSDLDKKIHRIFKSKAEKSDANRGGLDK